MIAQMPVDAVEAMMAGSSIAPIADLPSNPRMVHLLGLSDAPGYSPFNAAVSVSMPVEVAFAAGFDREDVVEFCTNIALDELRTVEPDDWSNRWARGFVTRKVANPTMRTMSFSPGLLMHVPGVLPESVRGLELPPRLQPVVKTVLGLTFDTRLLFGDNHTSSALRADVGYRTALTLWAHIGALRSGNYAPQPPHLSATEGEAA